MEGRKWYVFAHFSCLKPYVNHIFVDQHDSNLHWCLTHHELNQFVSHFNKIFFFISPRCRAEDSKLTSRLVSSHESEWATGFSKMEKLTKHCKLFVHPIVNITEASQNSYISEKPLNSAPIESIEVEILCSQKSH